MGNTVEDRRTTLVRAQAISDIVRELARRISSERLTKELGISEQDLRGWTSAKREYSHNEFWRVILIAYKYGFFDLLNARGLPSPSYEIGRPFNLLMAPIGFEVDPPLVPLIDRPTMIAGYRVDFPLGLPASVLATNAKWIEFYARRGFDILTYKTVRTEYRDAHPWPNWVFLKNPVAMESPFNTAVTGFPEYWPEDLTTVSMANSFGIPSLAPEAWQDDVRKARQIVREGHQVFIVSVVASRHDDESVIADDFVKAALMAKNSGADIVELNYSCPNVIDDPSVGEIYKVPDVSGRISKAVKTALEETPLFVKIGYLSPSELRAFVISNAPWINGIVAINTITARVVNDDGKITFPGRETAGVSGWAIRARAQEVAKNLVELREDVFRDLKKRLAILGLGGVLTAQDVSDYLDKIGVDGVESCTGAFLNPLLGLHSRFDVEALKRRPSRLAFEFQYLKDFFAELFTRSSAVSRIRLDPSSRIIAVERSGEDR
jgi:dihydroorotate dehydrogenase (NAD+) catalytic subunit